MGLKFRYRMVFFRRNSMKYTASDRMNSLPFSGIRAVMEKATQMQQAGENIIHMEIGRPDFDTPEKIKAAATKSPIPAAAP